MTGRACAKEELCCRKIKCLVEAHEANLNKGNYDVEPNGNEWREYIRELIDRCAARIEAAQLGFINGDDPPSS